jgi:hypothetical protein
MFHDDKLLMTLDKVQGNRAIITDLESDTVYRFHIHPGNRFIYSSDFLTFEYKTLGEDQGNANYINIILPLRRLFN